MVSDREDGHLRAETVRPLEELPPPPPPPPAPPGHPAGALAGQLHPLALQGGREDRRRGNRQEDGGARDGRQVAPGRRATAPAQFHERFQVRDFSISGSASSILPNLVVTKARRATVFFIIKFCLQVAELSRRGTVLVDRARGDRAGRPGGPGQPRLAGVPAAGAGEGGQEEKRAAPTQRGGQRPHPGQQDSGGLQKPAVMGQFRTPN